MQKSQDIASQEATIAGPLLSTEAEGQKGINNIESHTNLQSQTEREERKISDQANEKENAQEFSSIEQVGGQDLYKTLVESDKLCGAQAWKRVLREVKDVNDEFHSLRTCIGVVKDTIGALHYLVYPADGAMADKPLCGRILIPKDYPNVPPVVHLFTKTNRYNVDVYYSQTEAANLNYLKSSMCFDILRSKNDGDGRWNPDYTLSALVASLVQAIVSTKVFQMGGYEKEEFVSMSKLGAIHKSVESTYKQFKTVMPALRDIPRIEGMSVPTKYFTLPEKMQSLYDNKELIIQSDPISLQVEMDKMRDNVYSIGLDLSDLKSNRGTVFSIILSNTPLDPVGNKTSTVLVRNGVTATAAKKKVGGATLWFYHGRPMQESNLKLIVTVGYDQFCITYLDGNRKIIHGDRPVSFLTRAEIGDVKGQNFYLSIFMKNHNSGATVMVKTFKPEEGYVHPVANRYIDKENDEK